LGTQNMFFYNPKLIIILNQVYDKMRVLQWMKKTNDYYGTLYAGIIMNVKTSDYYGTHMGCCNECKKPTTIMGPYM
jgi:thymidine kinase